MAKEVGHTPGLLLAVGGLLRCRPWKCAIYEVLDLTVKVRPVTFLVGCSVALSTLFTALPHSQGAVTSV